MSSPLNVIDGKHSRKWANEQNICDFEKKKKKKKKKKKRLTQVFFYLALGYLVYSYISQISDERLQDHWSSGSSFS